MGLREKNTKVSRCPHFDPKLISLILVPYTSLLHPWNVKPLTGLLAKMKVYKDPWSPKIKVMSSWWPWIASGHGFPISNVSCKKTPQIQKHHEHNCVCLFCLNIVVNKTWKQVCKLLVPEIIFRLTIITYHSTR